jgi:hypothetical protein
MNPRNLTSASCRTWVKCHLFRAARQKSRQFTQAANAGVIRENRIGTFMANINHSRPYLKYIDNIRRENEKAAARYQSNKTTTIAEKSYDKRKRTTFWDKMAAINLSEFEEQRIFLLFDLVAKYYDTSAESISLILENGKQKRKKALKEQVNEIYEELVHVGEKIVASELAAQMKGRKQGVFDWLNLLKPKLLRDGAYDFWDLVNNHVFKDAFSNVEAKLDI